MFGISIYHGVISIIKLFPVIACIAVASYYLDYCLKNSFRKKDIDKPTTKHKEKKKQKKSTLSLDEFCEGYSTNNLDNCNEYQLRLHRLQESKRVIEEKADLWNTAISSTHPFSSNAINAADCLDAFNDSISFERKDIPVTEDNIFQSDLSLSINLYFKSLLDDHGFLPLNSPFLQNAIENLDPNAKAFIEEKGGFINYIQCDGEFAIVKDTLCRFSDMLNIYQQDNFSRDYSLPDNMDAIDIIDNSLNDNISYAEKVKFQSYNASAFGSQSKMDALDDADDAKLRRKSSSGNLIPSDFLTQFDDAENKGCMFVTPVKTSAEKFLLNPHATEYNPSKENNSECSSSSQDVSKSEVQPASLFDRLASMRQELSSYSVKNLHPSPDYSKSPTKSKIPSQPQSQKLPETPIKKQFPFVDQFHRHFANLFDKGDTEEIHKSYYSLKSLLQQLEKTYNLNKSVNIQAGTPAVLMISQGVMKTDDELEAIIQDLPNLKEQNKKMLEEKKLVEIQLSDALDKQTELKNRYETELSSLKKEIQNDRKSCVDEIKEMKKKQIALEKDIRTWRQKYEEVVEKEKELDTSNKKQKVKLETYTKKLTKYEEEITSLNEEVQFLSNSKIKLAEDFTEKMKQEESLLQKTRTDLEESNSRLKTAELEVLKVKKSEVTKVYNIYFENVNKKIQELKVGLARVGTFSPQVLNTVQMLEGKFKDVIHDITTKYKKYLSEVSLLEQKVRSGIPLFQLKEVEYPVFPEIPTIDSFMPFTLSNAAFNSNNQFSNMQPLSQNFQLSNNAFTKSGQEYIHRGAQNEFGLSHFDQNNQFNSLNGPSLSVNQISNNQQMRNNSLFNQNNYSQNPVMPMSNNALLHNLLPGKEQISHSNSMGSQLLRGVASASPSSAQGDNEIKYPPGLTSRTSSFSSNSDVSTEIPKLNAMLKSSQVKSPIKTASSLYSLDNLSRPSSAMSETLSSTRSNPVSSLSTFKQTQENADVNASGKASKISFKGHDDLELDKMTKGFTRVIDLLRTEFPDKKDAELMSAIKTYREQKGRLANLPISTVVEGVKNILMQQSKLKSQRKVPDSIVQTVRPKLLVNKPLTSSSAVAVMPPPTVSKPTSHIAPWANVNAAVDKPSINWTVPAEKRLCCICLDPMTKTTAYKVDCGHLFHFKCIKEWLSNQSNCPECRVHLLLPEDFPSLS